MRSHWIIWPLFLSFCLQELGQTLIIGRFYLHRARIERTLCENKAKPEMKCHGKCQLKKQLAASPVGEKQDQTIPEIREWILNLPAQMSELLLPVSGWREQKFYVALIIATGFLPDVFHPPSE